MTNKTISPKITALAFGVMAVSFLAVFYVVAWTEPSETPPQGNIATALNTSNVGQSKEGGLVLNIGGAADGLIVDRGNTILREGLSILGGFSFGGKSFMGWASFVGAPQIICKGVLGCEAQSYPGCLTALNCIDVCSSSGCTAAGTYRKNSCTNTNCATYLGGVDINLCFYDMPEGYCRVDTQWQYCGLEGGNQPAQMQCSCNCPSGTTYQVPIFQ